MPEAAGLCAGLAAASLVAVLARTLVIDPDRLRRGRLWRAIANTLFGWRGILRSAGDDGRLPPGVGARVNLAAALAGSALGLALLGAGGALLGALLAPPACGLLLRARRARYAARIDAGAAELALALASSLAAGRSVRAALLAADAAIPAPLSAELARVAVDLALGSTTDDALVALRSRTASDRIDSLAGAIALHRRSGADLARLMRELAAAFRARDAACADARSATAQARFTALLVGAIPPVAGVLTELAVPGSVSGALSFAPTALLMFAASALMLIGALLCLRVSRT